MAKQKRAFSKTLLIQESALLWIMTLAFLGLAYMCIDREFAASLPWLAAMVSFPWAAYGVSQVYYYKKSMAENTAGGITYESAFNNSNSAEDVLTVDKIDVKPSKDASTFYSTTITTIKDYENEFESESKNNITNCESDFESGTNIDDFPDLNSKKSSNNNLQPDIWGPI